MLMQILLLCRHPAADVPLGLVDVQHLARLRRERRVDLRKALGDVPLKVLETTVIGESKAEPPAPARAAPSDRPAGQARPAGRDGRRPLGRGPFKR